MPKKANPLADSTKVFLKKFIGDKEELEWCIEQLTYEGPEHKQVMNALLLKNLQQLVKRIEKLSGTAFTLQKGEELYGLHPEHLQHIPVAFPIGESDPVLLKKRTKVIAHAPDHEILLYALLAQITQWSTKALKKINVSE